MDVTASHEVLAPALTVTVIGMGYVGLPTALALTASGVDVTGYDISRSRLDDIAAGDVDLIAADHARLVRHINATAAETAARGRAEAGDLGLTDDPACLTTSDALIIAVPTPVTRDHTPDLAALRAACADVVAHARPGQTIILTSTTYVGCTRDLLTVPLAERGLRVGEDIHVAFSPERIDPGNTVHTQDTTPRVVGGVTGACTQAAAAVISRCSPRVHPVSSPEAAEMTKLLENTFRALNIAWINEMADVAEGLGLSISEVIEAASTKGYGFMPFTPGPGVGGHCIPCDPHYLLHQLGEGISASGADTHGSDTSRVQAPITAQAMRGLARRPGHVVTRALQILEETFGNPVGATVHLAGVAYKPGVRDVRESPALDILTGLRAHGVHVAYHDPLVAEVTLPDGTTLAGIPAESVPACDLVIWHTPQPGMTAAALLEGAPAVLDVTYRLAAIPGTARPHRL